MAASTTDEKEQEQQQAEQPRKKSLLNASAAGAAFLVLVQVLSRLLTFVMNQTLIRYLSPAILGQAAQLELYMMTILFFSRESLRMALQRQAESSNSSTDDDPKQASKKPDSKKEDIGDVRIIEGTSCGQAQTVVNSSYLAVPMGIAVIAGGWVLQTTYTQLSDKKDDSDKSGSNDSTNYFQISLAIYAIASLLELLSEPGFALAQQRMLYSLRAACESSAVISNCAVTLAVTVFASRYLTNEGGLETLPFAIGQVVFATCLVLGYPLRLWGIAKQEGFSLGIKKIWTRTGESYYFHRPTIWIAGTMWFQSVIKHILTQGDSMLVIWFATTEDQGIYALAANYGSLIARLLFKPIEETSRNLLSKLLNTDEQTPKDEKRKEEDRENTPSQENIAEALTILHLILRFYTILSTLIASLGPTLAPLALRKVAGARWADSPAAKTLSTYCYYIPLLAVNGITEAFVQSVATTRELGRQSVWMLWFSVVFGVASWGFVKRMGMGADGLVWANCVNMLMRVVWSCGFIRGYFRRVGRGRGVEIGKVLPGSGFVAVAVAAGAVARRVVSERGVLMDYVKGGGLAGIVALVCLYSERKFFIECYKLFKLARKR
ncbi:Oligosaccharide translocation protein rft1 [Orbilia ellipsospora]|uniref:Man(5)GlcNAc(2)-PP-dolichol translocation protein RFT1 n=1 Tax=Orbilia ellipsospora TaxID=2528407 RepID=A0AAV9XPW0_9PEZI